MISSDDTGGRVIRGRESVSRRHWDHLGGQRDLSAWRPGGWLKFPMTNNVHALSTKNRQRPEEHVYNSSTANAGNTGHNPGCRCPDTSFFHGDASGVSAGRSNPEIQQYIIELAGVVPTVRGGS